MADGNRTDISTELADVLTDLIDGAGVPGIAAGVLVAGETYTAGVGTTSVDHPQDVDAGTLFQVGSVSKTFTSALVMQLVEDGRIDLDDPVARHLPALGAATASTPRPSPIEHVLSHQAGFDGDHLFAAASRRPRRPRPAPGACSSRATGFSYVERRASPIAGAVIEAVTGRALRGRSPDTRLLDPLGVRSAGWRADAVITHKVAMPHVTLGDETFVLRAGGWQPGWELGPLDRAAAGSSPPPTTCCAGPGSSSTASPTTGPRCSASRAWSGCTPRSWRRRRPPGSHWTGSCTRSTARPMSPTAVRPLAT